MQNRGDIKLRKNHRFCHFLIDFVMTRRYLDIIIILVLASQ